MSYDLTQASRRHNLSKQKGYSNGRSGTKEKMGWYSYKEPGCRHSAMAGEEGDRHYKEVFADKSGVGDIG